MRSIRTFLMGVGVGAMLVAGLPGLSGPVMGQVPAATIRGSEQQNFGRILITLPSAQRATAQVANGVLVVSFAEPVRVNVDRIVRDLPSFVSVARIDPDGRGIRFALTRTVRANLLEAAEKVFVDLIPENWQGLLPSLPQEVVAELAERARAAEAAARSAQRQRQQAQPRDIEVSGSRLPTLQRMVFGLPRQIEVDDQVGEGALTLGFKGTLKIDPGKVRAALPDGVVLDGIESEDGLLTVKLKLRQGLEVATFREDDSFVVDVTDRNRPRPTSEASVQAAAAPRPELPAVQPAPASAEAAPAPVAAPSAVVLPPATTAAPGQPRQGNAPPAAIETAATASEPRAIGVTASSASDGVRIDFAFPRRTAAAAFQDRGETVLVFDTIDTLEPAKLAAAAGAHLVASSVSKDGRATVVRLEMASPGLMRFAPDGLGWALTIGDKGVRAATPVNPRRTFDEAGQAVVSLALPEISGVHWLTDPTGQQHAVATAFGPGVLSPKPQRFVHFQLEQTMQGIAVRPFADDVAVRAGVGEVLVSRSGGLALTTSGVQDQTVTKEPERKLVADRAAWSDMRSGDIHARLRQLHRQAADAPRSARSAARLELGAFLLANGLAPEALGPVAIAVLEDPNMRRDRRPAILSAMAHAMMGRAKATEAALSAAELKDDPEAALWRAVADAIEGRFPKAMATFRRSGEIIDAYPDNLQAVLRRQMVLAALSLRDQSVAERELILLSALAPEWLHRDEAELLRAQLDEISGKPEAALAGYKALFDSAQRPVAARAQLKAVQLADREKDPSISEEEKVARLETLALIWRGDEVEIEAIGELGDVYAGQQRWREAFSLARQANTSFPDHPITRKLHDETSRQFEELFTSGRADQLSRIDALALFYDFKEFLPIGRRGDEIIRRLSDRLVEVDLLDQAAELLQHQIENRLTGAARATVATRLAMVQLMNSKPAEALKALAQTRLPELPRDVKRARLLLEAKALSDLSRTDLAIETLANESGPEVDRLRGDILWSARRWREAGEVHERILGDAWRGAEPLDERQRADAMRAAVAYVMSGEALSLDRLRAKFAAPMSKTPDARTFAFVTGTTRAAPGDLRELARNVANAGTLMEFMGEYRKRYPELSSSLRRAPQPGEGPPASGAPPAADAATPAAQPAAPPVSPAAPAPPGQAQTPASPPRQG